MAENLMSQIWTDFGKHINVIEKVHFGKCLKSGSTRLRFIKDAQSDHGGRLGGALYDYCGVEDGNPSECLKAICKQVIGDYSIEC